MEDKEIIEKLKQVFKEKKFKGYDTSEHQTFYVLKKENFNLRNGSSKNVYIVSFSGAPIFGERKALDAIMDSETLEFYYIMGPSGYIDL